jgi:hypothetical protein
VLHRALSYSIILHAFQCLTCLFPCVCAAPNAALSERPPAPLPPSTQSPAAVTVTPPTATPPAPHPYATRSASKSRMAPPDHHTPAAQRTPAAGSGGGTPQTASQRAAQRRTDLGLSVTLTSGSIGLPPAADIVPQDTSPQLGDSPTGAEAVRRRHEGDSLLATALLAQAHRASPAGGPGGKEGRSVRRAASSSPSTPDSDPSLSPTERSIRESLRRSARRRTTGPAWI